MIPLQHRTVVVPVDFSDETEAAIRSGIDRVTDVGHLHIVHVLYPLDYTSPGVMWNTVTDESRTEAAEKNLKELLKPLDASKAVVSVLVGDAGLKVTEYARNVDADLIVVPSHGYHGVKRLLLGSTAERIVRYAHCPVLVLRRKDAD